VPFPKFGKEQPLPLPPPATAFQLDMALRFFRTHTTKKTFSMGMVMINHSDFGITYCYDRSVFLLLSESNVIKGPMHSCGLSWAFPPFFDGWIWLAWASAAEELPCDPLCLVTVQEGALGAGIS